MKVKHLILRLQECDPEAMVVVDGYEGGLSELKNIEDSIELALNVNHEKYYGKHESANSWASYPDNEHTNAVYLPRS